MDALRGIYNMSSSTWQPTYIYIKENRIHNNKREKSGQSILVERLSYFNKTLWLVCILVTTLFKPVTIWLAWRLHIRHPTIKW